ncbi:hypothetical protein RJ640_024690 [Escallonia rubra]|uniref:AMP-dependent synthetase/ligase domain-containing protein n=1 Tax=Escallonia rubra TaxID=112253 RepID=A0AA88RIM8_9ASTE|nr:hypothetical protein RJ640_024690 [Escallonia rubra]
MAYYKGLDCIAVSDITGLGIPSDTADRLHESLTEIVGNYGAATQEAWQRISTQVLSPDLPFSFHQMMYYGCYKDFGPDPPAWLPDPEAASFTNVGQLLERRGQEFLGSRYKGPIPSFSDFQEFSVSNPEVYWKTVLDEMCVSFSVPPQCILREELPGESQLSHPGGQWLPGAHVNPARNCLSLNTMRTLEDIMLMWRDEGDDALPVKKITLKELRSEVWYATLYPIFVLYGIMLVAYGLETLGLEKGSAIAIDMPMDVNSVVIYLAIVLAGYVVVSIADSFASNEISTRLVLSEAKAIFTQVQFCSKVIAAQSPVAIVIHTRGSSFDTKLRDGDISWHDFLERARDYKLILISDFVKQKTGTAWSQTTETSAIEKKKQAAKASGVEIVVTNQTRQHDMHLPPSQGSKGRFWNPWQALDAKVTMLGVIPSIVRTWKITSCTASYDWSAIRCFGSTGEASNVDEYLWLMGRANYKPIIEYCGGTEIGGGFVSGSLLQPQSLASFSTPAMGCSLFILGDDGLPIPSNVPGIGELALGPIMFGASSTLLNANHYDVYFKQMPVWNAKVLRRHGDVFERTSRGYYHAHGRADDTMNLGGIKVSSVEIERICNLVDNTILETAAIGVPPPGGGPEKLVIAVAFQGSNELTRDLDKLRASLNSALQKKLNPLFKVSYVVPLSSLPRTATNKVMRRVLRQQIAQLDHSKL